MENKRKLNDLLLLYSVLQSIEHRFPPNKYDKLN